MAEPLVRIESNGSVHGTRVFAGNLDITRHVEKIEWSHDVGSLPRAVVTLGLIEMTAEAVEATYRRKR